MNSKSFFRVLLCSLFLSAASSQFAMAEEGGMSEEQMQQMMEQMEQMEKMQACMARIDQSDMDKLSARAQAMDKEIKALCAAGKRDQAQQIAIDYGREMSKSKEMEEMMKCGEMARRMMGGMAVMAQEGEASMREHHVCDSQM